MAEKIQGMRESVTAISQRLQAPKTWLGSSGVNVLQVLCDLIDLVEAMNIQLATHTHVPGPTPSPADANQFNAKAAQALLLAGKLKPITA